MAEVPRGRERATQLNVTVTLSLTTKAQDRAMAYQALAYCLEAFERRGAIKGRTAPAGGSTPAATARPGLSPGTDDEVAVILRSLGYARSRPLDLPWQLPGVMQTSLESRLREGMLRPEELADQVASAMEQLLTPERRSASIARRA